MQTLQNPQKLPSLDTLRQLDYDLERTTSDNLAQIDALEEYLSQAVEAEQEAQISKIEEMIEAKENQVEKLYQVIERKVREQMM